MKTTVSILNRIFCSAQQFAARWGISRSKLYAKALDALIEKHNDDLVTGRLNEVYGPDREDSSLDPTLAALQHRTLSRNE